MSSNPGHAVPKALKMVPVATLLGSQHYKASTGFSSPNKYHTTNFATLTKIKSLIIINVCIHRRTLCKIGSHAKYVILLKYRDYYYCLQRGSAPLLLYIHKQDFSVGSEIQEKRLRYYTQVGNNEGANQHGALISMHSYTADLPFPEVIWPAGLLYRNSPFVVYLCKNKVLPWHGSNDNNFR